MNRLDRYSQHECWMDIFEDSQFMGKMRRIFGPAELKHPRAKSVIVGPRANVRLDLRRAGKAAVVHFDANRLIPSLSEKLRGAMIQKVTVVPRNRAGKSAPKSSKRLQRA